MGSREGAVHERKGEDAEEEVEGSRSRGLALMTGECGCQLLGVEECLAEGLN